MTSTWRSATSTRPLQLDQQAADQVDLAAQPQAHVGGHLVVAAAAGVQALAGVAHQLRQAGLDVQVHVLQVELPVELAGLDLGADLGHAALDGGQVLGAMMPWAASISAWARLPVMSAATGACRRTRWRCSA
jgi:hypothetical protein